METHGLFVYLFVFNILGLCSEVVPTGEVLLGVGSTSQGPRAWTLESHDLGSNPSSTVSRQLILCKLPFCHACMGPYEDLAIQSCAEFLAHYLTHSESSTSRSRYYQCFSSVSMHQSPAGLVNTEHWAPSPLF